MMGWAARLTMASVGQLIRVWAVLVMQVLAGHATQEWVAEIVALAFVGSPQSGHARVGRDDFPMPMPFVGLVAAVGAFSAKRWSRGGWPKVSVSGHDQP